MKISTKGIYGLRAMVDLAVNSSGDHVTLKSIAERQDISENYLEHVFSALRKAGLISSTKGSQGGYTLAAMPEAMTVGEILRALEGDLTIIDEKHTSKNRNNAFEHCISTKVWDAINESIASVVDSITLGDLVQEYKRYKGESAFMYFI